MRWNSLATVAAGFMLTTSLAIAQVDQTLTGTVGDVMCGKKHTMGDDSPAQCTRECVKGGSDYALIVGDKVYTLKGNKTEMDKFAGAKVTVKGKVSGSVVTADSIKAAP
jgi:hypothetical protein